MQKNPHNTQPKMVGGARVKKKRRRIFPSHFSIHRIFPLCWRRKKTEKELIGKGKKKRRGKSFCLTQTTGERESRHRLRKSICTHHDCWCACAVGWSGGLTDGLEKFEKLLGHSPYQRTNAHALFLCPRIFGRWTTCMQFCVCVAIAILQLHECVHADFRLIFSPIFVRWASLGWRVGWMAWNVKRCRAHRVSHGDAGENPTVESTSIHTQ